MKNLFKYASLLAAAAMLFSCEGNVDPEQGEGGGEGPKDPNLALVVTPDKNIVQTFGGDYITFTVTLGEEVVTEGVTFYEDNTPVTLDGMKYSTTVAGEHVLKANYGTYISEDVILRAFSVEIPDTPEDPQPNSTDFKARVLLTQFTTTGCAPCVLMKDYLHSALEDKDFADKVILTACHSGIIEGKPYADDPAYIQTGFQDFVGSTSFPFVDYDMMLDGFSTDIASTSGLVKKINTHFDEVKTKPAGIAVNSALADGRVVAKVTVKAAEAGPYRVGAFLLEDGITHNQNGATEDWMNTHDSVIRYIDAKPSQSSAYYGFPIGNIDAGKTADYLFDWDLDEIWEAGSKAAGLKKGAGSWKPFVEKNLHIVVFTCTTMQDGDKTFYYVNNVIDCPLNGQTKYEYK